MSETQVKNSGGRKLDPQRKAIMEAFDLNYQHPCKQLPRKYVEQLYACADNSARRLLLGIGRPID